MEKQYIYIFSNPKFSEIVKIGKSKQHPEKRVTDVTNGAGVYGKWQVEWYMAVPDADIAEKIAHYLLKEFREDPKKEFFKKTVFEAAKIIEKKLVEFFEIEKPLIWYDDISAQENKYKLTVAKAKLELARINLGKALKTP